MVASTALFALPAAAVPGDPFDMRAVCRDDFERFCSSLGSEATRDAILRCLAGHQADLSPACRIAVGEKSAAEEEPLPAPDRQRPGQWSAPPHP